MIPNVRSMTKAEHDAMVARDMREDVLQEKLRRLATMELPVPLRWRYYHTHRAQNSPAGFPDTVLVRPPRLVFAELKREGLRYQPSPAQHGWLDDLEDVAAALTVAAGIPLGPVPEVYLWRPSDLLSGRILAVLT